MISFVKGVELDTNRHTNRRPGWFQFSTARGTDLERPNAQDCAAPWRQRIIFGIRIGSVRVGGHRLNISICIRLSAPALISMTISFLSFWPAAIDALAFDVGREVRFWRNRSTPAYQLRCLARAQFLIHLDYHIIASVAQPSVAFCRTSMR